MADKKQTTKKADTKKKTTKSNKSKWTDGVGVPVDPKKVKWADKF